MQISKEPTEWIIVHAGKVLHISQWYFILLHVDQAFKDRCKQRLQQIRNLAKDQELYQVSFWEAPHGWYRNSPAIADLIDELIDSEQLWAYVLLNNPQVASVLALAEQELTAVHMDIGSDGYASFTGIGKYSSECFFTAEIPLLKIL